MGKDFENDPRYPSDEFPEGIAGNKVDKRNIEGARSTESRLKSRKVEGGKNFDAAESVDRANSVLERLEERGIIEFRDEPEEAEEAEEAEPSAEELVSDSKTKLDE